MTGSNAEPVSTPAHAQASAILLRLSKPLFEAWMRGTCVDPFNVHGNSWYALRITHEHFEKNRHTKLSGHGREQLIAALKVAHELAHDNDVQDAPPVEVCHCAVSEDIRDLAGLMALEAR